MSNSRLVRTGIKLATSNPDLFTFLAGTLIGASINLLTSLVWADCTILFPLTIFASILIAIAAFQCLTLSRITQSLWVHAGWFKAAPFGELKEKPIEKIFEELAQLEDYVNKFASIAKAGLIVTVLIIVGVGTLIGGKVFDLTYPSTPNCATLTLKILNTRPRATNTPSYP